MIDRYFPCQRVRERIRSCGCGELLDEFAERLHRRGYASATIRGGVWAVEHFATWLNGQKLKLHDATKDHVRSPRVPLPAAGAGGDVSGPAGDQSLGEDASRSASR